MPSKHERIAVVKDPPLADALASVAALVPAGRPAATLVHDLAIRGAQALRDEDERRRELRRSLAERITSGNPPWDREVLARIDELSAG